MYNLYILNEDIRSIIYEFIGPKSRLITRDYIFGPKNISTFVRCLYNKHYEACRYLMSNCNYLFNELTYINHLLHIIIYKSIPIDILEFIIDTLYNNISNNIIESAYGNGISSIKYLYNIK